MNRLAPSGGDKRRVRGRSHLRKLFEQAEVRILAREVVVADQHAERMTAERAVTFLFRDLLEA